MRDLIILIFCKFRRNSVHLAHFYCCLCSVSKEVGPGKMRSGAKKTSSPPRAAKSSAAPKVETKSLEEKRNQASNVMGRLTVRPGADEVVCRYQCSIAHYFIHTRNGCFIFFVWLRTRCSVTIRNLWRAFQVLVRFAQRVGARQYDLRGELVFLRPVMIDTLVRWLAASPSHR